VFFKNEISGIETKYHLHKTLRIVDPKGKVWEGEAQDFGKKFVASGVYTVVNSMYRKQWQEMEPVSFHSLRLVEDFVQNECTPLNPEGDPQLTGNRFVLELAKQYGDPVIVSDDSHYAHPDDKIVQDVRLLQSGNWRFYGSYHRKSSDEAFAYFKDRMGITKSEFEGWVENSRNWASRFDNFKFKNR
jgi:DNA polymerase III alpha subunit